MVTRLFPGQIYQILAFVFIPLALWAAYLFLPDAMQYLSAALGERGQRNGGPRIVVWLALAGIFGGTFNYLLWLPLSLWQEIAFSLRPLGPGNPLDDLWAFVKILVDFFPGIAAYALTLVVWGKTMSRAECSGGAPRVAGFRAFVLFLAVGAFLARLISDLGSGLMTMLLVHNPHGSAYPGCPAWGVDPQHPPPADRRDPDDDARGAGRSRRGKYGLDVISVGVLIRSPGP